MLAMYPVNACQMLTIMQLLVPQMMMNLSIEQAHFTYTFDNGISATFGRYGSKLGLEGEDPAGLWTFSRAYESNANMLVT